MLVQSRVSGRHRADVAYGLQDLGDVGIGVGVGVVHGQLEATFEAGFLEQFGLGVGFPVPALVVCTRLEAERRAQVDVMLQSKVYVVVNSLR